MLDTIVPNGAADRDGRFRVGDLILAVNNISTIDASHQRVISLMSNAGRSGQVTLRVRRKVEKEGNQLCMDLPLTSFILPCAFSAHYKHKN